VHDLTSRGVGLRVLSGQGAAIDTTTPAGKLVFGIFASLAEFEREVSTGNSFTSSGKSHSWLRPTRRSRAPSAQTISVALAISDTTRLGSSFTIGISADCFYHVVRAQAGIQ
jgi:hypothetical protein